MQQNHFYQRGRQAGADRRTFLKAAMAAGGLFFTERGLYAQALTLTPAQTEGPYYPDQLPLDQDNDLLIINDKITPAVGTIAWLSGRILDRNGSPVRGAVIEIWQSDNQGNYIHTQGINRGTVRDTNFQGYGKFETASNGEYLFRTIKPGLYPGRVRHVHAKVTLPGGRSLTTQLYVEGETGSDGVLNGVPAAQRAAVIKAWSPIADSAVGALAVNWDVVMDFTPSETAAATRPTLVSMAGVVDGATLRSGAAGGSWVTLFGSALSTTTRTWGAADITGGKLPESLDGVSVRINNQPASVYYISPEQINVLAPEAAVDGDVDVTVTNAAGTSTAVKVNLRRINPGFFQFPGEYAAAVSADGALLAPPQLVSGVPTRGARPGEAALLFGTGFGPTNPAIAAGVTFSDPAPAANVVKVFVNEMEVPVAFAGLVSPGLYQLNITVPNLADGDYPVIAKVGDVWTSKIARLRIARQTAAAAAVPAAPSAYADVLRRIHRVMA